MSLLLLLTATAVALLLLGARWLRRTHPAVLGGRGPLLPQPLPSPCPASGGAGAGCGVLLAPGAQVLAASAVDTAPGPGTAPAAPAAAPAPKPAPPKRKKPDGPSRRRFLRNAWLTAILGSVSAFTYAMIAQLWPTKAGGFGGIVEVGPVAEVLDEIRAGDGQYAYPSGRMYLVSYDRALDVNQNYLEVTQDGTAPVMAIYQKCVHLGCRVPWCATSQWFECPCHGSRYNRWGEYQFGPAPRSLDRFPVTIQEGKVIVNTNPATIVTGGARGAGSLDQPPAGPHCN